MVAVCVICWRGSSENLPDLKLFKAAKHQIGLYPLRFSATQLRNGRDHVVLSPAPAHITAHIQLWVWTLPISLNGIMHTREVMHVCELLFIYKNKLMCREVFTEWTKIVFKNVRICHIIFNKPSFLTFTQTDIGFALAEVQHRNRPANCPELVFTSRMRPPARVRYSKVLASSIGVPLKSQRTVFL